MITPRRLPGRRGAFDSPELLLFGPRRHPLPDAGFPPPELDSAGAAEETHAVKPPRILCFGEVLWDCLPSGRLPGGAPLNVAYHLARLGAEAVMLSAVGHDPLGEEMLAYLAARGLNTGFVSRHPSLPTGTVTVRLSEAGQPSYTINEGVAWDEVTTDPSWRQAAEGARALVFGSLAARTAANRQALDELLAVPGLLRVMDVNLRAPYDDRETILDLARRADWLKVNEHELAALTGHTFESGGEDDGLVSTIKILGDQVGCRRICVTCGERGAVLYDDGAVFTAEAPAIVVADTIGAGDAFTAALVHGLLTKPESPQEIVEQACALGGLVASLPGGQPEYDLETLAVPGFGAGC